LRHSVYVRNSIRQGHSCCGIIIGSHVLFDGTVSSDLAPPPSNRHHWSNGDWWVRGKLSGLFCAILCATVVHSAVHIRMNRPNSSLDWVLSHWAHFTVLRFFLCMYYFVYHCVLHACVVL